MRSARYPIRMKPQVYVYLVGVAVISILCTFLISFSLFAPSTQPPVYDLIPPPPLWARTEIAKALTEIKGRADEPESYAYATFVGSRSYIPGALTLYRSVFSAGSRRLPFLALCMENVLQKEDISLLSDWGFIVVIVPYVKIPPAAQKHEYLASTCTKLNLWTQTQFTKILYLDADIIVQHPLDDMFNMVDGSSSLVAASHGEPIINSGVLVFYPSETIHSVLLRSLFEEYFPHRFQDQATIGVVLQNYLRFLDCADHVLSINWSLLYRGFIRCPVDPGRHVGLAEARIVHWVSIPKPWIDYELGLVWNYNFVYWAYYNAIEQALGKDYWSISQCFVEGSASCRSLVNIPTT